MTSNSRQRSVISAGKYNLLQFFYWMGFCIMLCFSSVYLLGIGLSNTRIGLMLGSANIISAFLSPTLAAVTDRNRSIRLEYLVGSMFFGVSVLSVMAVLLSDSKTAVSVIFVMMLVLVFSSAPSTNAMAFRAQESGIRLDFAAARGVGSVAYALTSIGAGYVFDSVTPKYMPLFYAGIFAFAALSTVLCAQPSGVEKQTSGSKIQQAERDDRGLFGFIKQYRRELVLLVGAIFIFYDHMLINNFMKQIISYVGGTTAQMGIVVAIAAFAEFPVMFFFSWIGKRVRCDTMLRFASIIYVIKHLVTYMARSVTVMYFAAFLQMFSYALFITAILYYFRQVMSGRDLVKGQALANNIITVGSIFASLTGGWLLDNVGVSAALLIGLVLTLIGTVTVFVSVRPVRLEE